MAGKKAQAASRRTARRQHLRSLRLTGFGGLDARLAVQSAISELQAPAWSCLAEPSLWPDTKRERVSFCCRVQPCGGVSLLLGLRSALVLFWVFHGTMLTRFLNPVISLALMRPQNCLPVESMTALIAVRR